jgi:hypothetical protein
MGIEPVSGDAENRTQSGGGISRRSVMKAGAVAAWSVPLVQVVAASPAHAACSGNPVLDVNDATGARSNSGQGQRTITVPVKNTGGGTTSGLTVSIYPTQAMPEGWQLTGNWGTPSGSGTAESPYTFSAPSEATCGGSYPTLVVTVTTTSNTKQQARTFTGTAFAASPATSANFSVTP